MFTPDKLRLIVDPEIYEINEPETLFDKIVIEKTCQNDTTDGCLSMYTIMTGIVQTLYPQESTKWN